MTSPFHSIRWRLQLWHGLILLLAIAGVCLTVYQLSWSEQLRRIDEELHQKERGIIHAVIQSLPNAAPDGNATRAPSPSEIVERMRDKDFSLPPEVATPFLGTDPGYAYFSFRDRGGVVLIQSANAPDGLTYLSAPAKDFTEETRTILNRREFRRTSPQGWSGLVGKDITPELQDMRRFAWSLGAAGAAVWLLGLLGGWWLAGRALLPIEAISGTATRIAEGNLQERIDNVGGASELDELSRVLNQTFERLHLAFERQKQFTADAAHELRTPVTILLSETQRILKRERSTEEYREAFQTCAATADRMRHLIEGLLLLAREETSAMRTRHQPCDLAELARDAIAHLGPLASERRIELQQEFQPAHCHADATALAIVAANLIANAIQHHDGSGSVQITTRAEPTEVTLIVRDDGPGIPEQDLPHIFERFYRADKARTGASGHTGLGLAIVQSIVHSHRGSILVQSPPGQGTTFTIHIPNGAPDSEPQGAQACADQNAFSAPAVPL